MNLWGDVRGLESVRNFISYNEDGKNNSVIPIIYMNNLLQSMKYFYQRCNSAFAAEILEMIKSAIETRCNNISNSEIKELPTGHIWNLIETLRVYLSRKSNYKLAEQLELIIIKKLLNCHKIENKLKGLVELNRIKNKVSIAYGKEENKIMTGVEKQTIDICWLTYEYFITWVIKNEVLEMIFMDSVHPELIRRSFDIVRMLAKEDKMDKVYLDLIWNNANGAHEDTVRATLDLIQKLALDLNMN